MMTAPRLIFAAALLALAGCATQTPDPEKAALAFASASFSDLDGWASDSQQDALTAFARSCTKRKTDKWAAACAALPPAPVTADAARRYFETWFTPWRAEAVGIGAEGLFTGYYEAALNGSWTQHGAYQTPLRLRPDDLVMVDLGAFRDELKGQRIAGRVVAGNLKPYEDRAAIETGKLPAVSDRPLLWVDDPVDAFFLHIQGSGVVTMDDGSVVRVGYDAQNGHPYYAIGRELVKRGELSKDDVTMQSIRAWLGEHPDRAAEIMNTNKSYVFFRKLDGDGPLGGEGVALTPGRSLAVDRALHGYGAPVWLKTESPAPNVRPLARLVVAQDTGGAIRGPVRGDMFWGYGPEAERTAGAMKAKGRFWFLFPKGYEPPAQAGR